jgi:hypothetical protein
MMSSTSETDAPEFFFAEAGEGLGNLGPVLELFPALFICPAVDTAHDLGPQRLPDVVADRINVIE